MPSFAENKELVLNTVPEHELKQVTYQKLFWLFIVGSILGVLIEGFYWLIKYGYWETHVVTIWGPFCIIYGFGLVGCYLGSIAFKNKNVLVQFLAFVLIGSVVEFICGWVLEYGLHMYAWDYTGMFLSIKGYVSLSMSLIWGFLGVGFNFVVPHIERIFEKMRGNAWRVACVGLSIFMVINFAVTAVCFVRWKNRHEGFLPTNRIGQIIDERFNDEWMEKRFVEWNFISEKTTNNQ